MILSPQNNRDIKNTHERTDNGIRNRRNRRDIRILAQGIMKPQPAINDTKNGEKTTQPAMGMPPERFDSEFSIPQMLHDAQYGLENNHADDSDMAKNGMVAAAFLEIVADGYPNRIASQGQADGEDLQRGMDPGDGPAGWNNVQSKSEVGEEEDESDRGHNAVANAFLMQDGVADLLLFGAEGMVEDCMRG